MKVKLHMQILLIQFLLVMSCASSQQKVDKNNKMPQIVFNGNELSIDENKFSDFIHEIDQLFSECDDLYELIVTDQVIESIKDGEKYLEIKFPEKRILESGKFKEIEFDRILMPLTGKFHSSGQVAFFTGLGNYTNTPLVNSKGSFKLDEVLKKIIN